MVPRSPYLKEPLSSAHTYKSYAQFVLDKKLMHIKNVFIEYLRLYKVLNSAKTGKSKTKCIFFPSQLIVGFFWSVKFLLLLWFTGLNFMSHCHLFPELKKIIYFLSIIIITFFMVLVNIWRVGQAVLENLCQISWFKGLLLKNDSSFWSSHSISCPSDIVFKLYLYLCSDLSGETW